MGTLQSNPATAAFAGFHYRISAASLPIEMLSKHAGIVANSKAFDNLKK
jgi:hypothetical protein